MVCFLYFILQFLLCFDFVFCFCQFCFQWYDFIWGFFCLVDCSLVFLFGFCFCFLCVCVSVVLFCLLDFDFTVWCFFLPFLSFSSLIPFIAVMRDLWCLGTKVEVSLWGGRIKLRMLGCQEIPSLREFNQQQFSQRPPSESMTWLYPTVCSPSAGHFMPNNKKDRNTPHP